MTALTVLSSVPRAIPAAAATYQVDVEELLAAAGIAPEVLDTPGARIPEQTVRRLWCLAVEATGDPCLGLVTAQKHHPTSFHALGFAWLASPTLGDMLKRMVRYERVIRSENWLVLEHEGERTAFRPVHPNDEEPAASCRADSTFATLLRWCRGLAGDDFAPAGVEFRHGDHDQRWRYEQVFGAALSFGASGDRFWFHNHVLARPLPGANAPLAAEEDRIVDAYLAGLTEEATARRVRELLVGLLPQGQADLDTVANKIFMSPRSLQRHLAADGYSFRDLLEETRKALAMEYVRNGRQPLIEVAFRLGFSDQSAFSKAFKRWTGSSPAAFATAGRGR